MHDDRPSGTASWVAGFRGLGAVLLPDDAQLIDDPYGVRFGGRGAATLARLASLAPSVARWVAPRLRPLGRFLTYMQVRTCALDDVLLEFVRAGGHQVVILGAGFDCRAARFERELDGCTVYEVDHPATQNRKRAVVAEPAHVVYLAWDFERQATADLPAALAARGHDPRSPTLTLWEGVTMYLTEPAIDATALAMVAYSAPRSLLAFTYFERARLERPPLGRRLVAAVVARIGEPWRFGWDPRALPAWLERRGLTLVADRSAAALGRLLLPRRYADLVSTYAANHIAVARVG